MSRQVIPLTYQYYSYTMSNINYTYSITSKGQITIPKEFRERLGLDKVGKATIQVNDKNEIVITTPKNLPEVRTLLSKPSFKDSPSEKEQTIGTQLAEKYDVH
jgi:AbrB family looped-hinge helix DNA binding protein